MNILALYATKNTTKPDATGAFIPQSTLFARARRARGDTVELVGFDNLLPKPRRRAEFLRRIETAAPFDALCYFGHGTRRGLPSAGLELEHVRDMGAAIRERARGGFPMPKGSRFVVTLYACSAANTPIRDNPKTAELEGIDGDGGFADELRDDLSAYGALGWVDAHTIAGHTTVNRYTRRFYIDGLGEGKGGRWLIAPGSPEWPAWGTALKKDPSLRFGFPFMTERELHDYLPG